MKKTAIRALAASGVAAVGALSFMGTAGAAPGNINPDTEGSLTLHKYLHQTAGSGDGNIAGPSAPSGWTGPVAGVEFTMYPLLKGGAPVDLKEQSAWNGLDQLVPGAACEAPAGFTKGAGTPMALTDSSGITTATGLGQTAFLVCETAAPANIVDRAQPFIVTVPMPDGQGGWLYNVHAYPKNGEGSIAKTIVAQDINGLGVGSLVQFPVSSPIPTMGEEWAGLAISDTFDSRLTPGPISSVTVDGTEIDGSYWTTVTNGQEVVMQFTAAGLAWLDGNAQAGKALVVTFDTTINAEYGDGIIHNTADLWVNNPGRDSSVRPPLPSNEVTTNWGNLELVKQDAASGNTLEGAVFEVYAASSPYGGSCDAATATGSALTVDGQTSFTSDANGLVTIPGLFVSDSVHPTINAGERCYVVKETAAPAGYILPTDADTGVAVKIGQTTSVDRIAIENTQQGVPNLPLTGGQGKGLLFGLGGAFVLGAGGLMLVKRRGQSDDAESNISA